MGESSRALKIREPSLSADGFAALCAEALILELPGGHVRVTGRLMLAIEYPGGTMPCSLETVWAECREKPEARARLAEEYLKSVLQNVPAGAIELQLPVEFEPKPKARRRKWWQFWK